jgi:hypothetical protein
MPPEKRSSYKKSRFAIIYLRTSLHRLVFPIFQTSFFEWKQESYPVDAPILSVMFIVNIRTSFVEALLRLLTWLRAYSENGVSPRL